MEILYSKTFCVFLIKFLSKKNKNYTMCEALFAEQ